MHSRGWKAEGGKKGSGCERYLCRMHSSQAVAASAKAAPATRSTVHSQHRPAQRQCTALPGSTVLPAHRVLCRRSMAPRMPLYFFSMDWRVACTCVSGGCSMSGCGPEEEE